MLTRLYVDNFRCFVNFEYKPEQKQLLLGSNGSGKSSLLDVVRYIKSFIAGDENPFTQSKRTRWQDRPIQVIEVEALLDGKEYGYKLEIQFEPESRQPSVNFETLRVSGRTWFEVVNGQLRFFMESGSQEVTKPPDAARSALHLSRLSSRHVHRFMEWLDSVHCFQIDAYFDAMDETADGEDSQPDFELQNIARWYRHLLRVQPAQNVRFLTSLKETMDGFEELRFYSAGGEVERLRAVFRVTDKTVSYALSELSDGQRYLIALYMILHFSLARGDTVFIDEPDSFTALREIQPWLLAAEEAVEDHNGQLILISHHPEILNQWAVSYGLRFFRESSGYVRTEKFKAAAKGDLQPSELIARGWVDA